MNSVNSSVSMAMRWSMVGLVFLAGCGGGGGGGSGQVAAFGVTASVMPEPATASTSAATPAPGAVPAAGSTGTGTGSSTGTGSGSGTGSAAAPMVWKVTELATGLDSPWGLAFLPDGKMLVSHRMGQLRLRNPDGSAFNGGANTVSGVPAVYVSGQGGLLDVAVDPAFASNRRIYFSYAESDAVNATLNSTAVARAELDLASRSLVNLTVIYRQTPKVDSGGHFGSRLVFDRNGFLFVTLGERLLDTQRGFAQDLTRGHGKVVRITTDGSAALGNPALGPGAQPGIWSYGHRNPQGAALHPATGDLWVNEHGPQGGDEVNLVQPGRNYGWPVISHGQEYGTLTQVGEGTAKAGMEQPVSIGRRAMVRHGPRVRRSRRLRRAAWPSTRAMRCPTGKATSSSAHSLAPPSGGSPSTPTRSPRASACWPPGANAFGTCGRVRMDGCIC